MIKAEISLRVRYSETDRMGYVYYGNYAAYFEVARVELLRSLGVTYRELEDKGILLPVANYTVNFHKPAYYDEVLTIHTIINTEPTVRITFDYVVYNAAVEKLCSAQTTLVFVNASTGKPTSPPDELRTLFKKHFHDGSD